LVSEQLKTRKQELPRRYSGAPISRYTPRNDADDRTRAWELFTPGRCLSQEEAPLGEEVADAK